MKRSASARGCASSALAGAVWLGTARRIRRRSGLTVARSGARSWWTSRASCAEALEGADGAAAALVYVPHTTAGVTINEEADPAVARDLEAALERIVDEGWPWQHVDDPDGPNAPSHIRASLIGPQVLVPLDGGELALGRWQGIFFCELDGPRERTVMRHAALLTRRYAGPHGRPRCRRTRSSS